MNAVDQQNDLIAFFAKEHPELSEAVIRGAINDVSADMREGRVCFGIDDRDLDDCGHYAVYGSEYQIAIAAHIKSDGRRDYQQTLRRHGSPAVVIADLPMHLIDEQTREGLARDLLQAALWSIQVGERDSPVNGFGFELHIDVPPEMISDIINIPEPLDPLRDRR